MRARMRVNGPAFERMRTRTQALMLTDGDRAGPLLRALDTVHAAQVRRAFSSQGASTGLSWSPWSAGYAAWRAKHPRLGKSIMRLTDTLYEKATSVLHGNHIARWMGALRFDFGFIDEPGYIHMNTEAARGKMPLRSALIKTERDHQEFVDRLVTYWRARIQQALRHG
jgi:hypothetical protein